MSAPGPVSGESAPEKLHMNDRDQRQDARDMLRPSPETLAAMLDGIISEGATQIRMIRSELEKKAKSAKGLSGRTLVGGTRPRRWPCRERRRSTRWMRAR